MKQFFNYKSLAASLSIALLYLIITIYLMNFSIVKDTIIGSFPLLYKGKLLLALLEGMWTAMTTQALSLLVFTSLLTGINISLLVTRLSDLKKQGKIRFVVGGSSLLGIIGSGCAACGLPVLALLGLTGSIAYLPLRGMELSYLSIALLLYSLYVLVTSTWSQSCNLTQQA